MELRLRTRYSCIQSMVSLAAWRNTGSLLHLNSDFHLGLSQTSPAPFPFNTGISRFAVLAHLIISWWSASQRIWTNIAIWYLLKNLKKEDSLVVGGILFWITERYGLTIPLTEFCSLVSRNFHLIVYVKQQLNWAYLK